MNILSGSFVIYSLKRLISGLIFILLLVFYSLVHHYFGQFLVWSVVFLSDDELIFLLLFETMISQACIKVSFETSKTSWRSDPN